MNLQVETIIVVDETVLRLPSEKKLLLYGDFCCVRAVKQNVCN